jgi:hypothetical protein
MISLFGPSGEAYFLQPDATGKGLGPQCFQGIGKVNFREAPAVKKSPVFNGDKALGYVDPFQENTVEKRTASQNHQGIGQRNGFKKGTSGKGPLINISYPHGNSNGIYNGSGKSPYSDTVNAEFGGNNDIPVNAPVLYEDPVPHHKVGLFRLLRPNPGRQEKDAKHNKKEKPFHGSNYTIDKSCKQ